MTFDELKARLAADCPFWGTREWDAFLRADPETQTALATAMHLSTQGPGPDGWAIALTILTDAEPALVLIPVIGPFVTSGIEVIKIVAGLV